LKMSFRVVLQLAVFVTIFGWVALGPYSAYYNQVIDQAKAPVEIAYRAVERAITDVWLLATNPTEWYARQQVVNVRPERPLDYPKGIEIISLDALPPSVAARQEFAVAAVIKNDGYIAAGDVRIDIGCNQWCETTAISVRPHDANRSRGTSFYIKPTMERGEAELVTISKLVSKTREGREAEAQFARVSINVSYSYSTNSSLQVSVIDENELNRRFRESDTVFKQVLAVGKLSPAQLSLNVGPQPLKSGTNAILLVSVSNTRDDSSVILERGDKIIIRMPKIVGSNLRCGSTGTSEEGENWKLEYTVEPNTGNRVKILAYEFNSIFAFICNFDANPSVSTITTGLITAELPRYTFVLHQKKDVPITPPLGIIFEPFEAECGKCGDGLRNLCDKSECEEIAGQVAGDRSKTCYYQDIPGDLVTGSCHVCGSIPSCGKFSGEVTCRYGATRCGWTCAWDPSYRDPITNLPKGICENIGDGLGNTAIVGPVSGTSAAIVQNILQTAREMKPAGADQSVRSEGVADTFEEMVLKLVSVESSRFRHCGDGTLFCITDTSYNSVLCSLPLSDERSSCGVMQININSNIPKRLEWRQGTNDYGCGGKGAYDLNCNIRLGIGLLIQNYNDWRNGNADPSCDTEPYRTKYTNYRGWRAAIRAYNGWGCPANYPGGIEAATNYVENVIGRNVSALIT